MPRYPAFLVLTFLLGAVAPVVHAQDDKEIASEHFDKGILLFKNDDFAAALIEFEAAYEAMPHFTVRYNIAICLYKLKEYGKAATQIQQYLAEGEDRIPDEKRAEVEEIYAELESLVATLRVDCNVDGAQVTIDGETVGTTPMALPLKLDVGEYEVQVTAHGYEPFTTTVKLPGGEQEVITADLVATGSEDPPQSQKLAPPAFIGMASATLALVASAAIIGGVALKRSSDYKASAYDEGWEDDQKTGRALALTADVLWGVAGAAAVTAVVLAIFTDFGSEKKPAVSFSPTGLTIQGVF